MSEPIQQRCGQFLVPKHLDPLAKGEITRNYGGALAMPFGPSVFILRVSILVTNNTSCYEGGYRSIVLRLAAPHGRLAASSQKG